MDEKENNLAELVALALSGRPASLVDLALKETVGMENVELARTELHKTTDALAAFASSVPAATPPPQVRSRLLATVAKLKKDSREPRRALLVIDMLNDHLTEGRPLEVPRARDIVPALAARIDDARKSGIPVVYVCDQHEPGDSDLDEWGAHNVTGTVGAEVWPALAPSSSDSIVNKPTYSGFTKSNLEAKLADLGVDTLVLTGCLTELGLLATATDALQRGYAVEVPPDTQAGASAMTEQVALGLLRIMPPYGPARNQLLARIAAT